MDLTIYIMFLILCFMYYPQSHVKKLTLVHQYTQTKYDGDYTNNITACIIMHGPTKTFESPIFNPCGCEPIWGFDPWTPLSVTVTLSVLLNIMHKQAECNFANNIMEEPKAGRLESKTLWNQSSHTISLKA